MKVYPVTVKGIPSVEEAEIQTEAEKVSEEMEKDQLISMIHFLVKREDEPTNETRAESNSFELCLVRRRQSIAQRAQENQEQTNERERRVKFT